MANLSNTKVKLVEICAFTVVDQALCVLTVECGEGMVSRYSCCKERSGSPGCQIAKVYYLHSN